VDGEEPDRRIFEPDFITAHPIMCRSALNRIEAHPESSTMVGDPMDTDVVAGIDTILVLTGTTVADIEKYPYWPDRVLGSIAKAIDLI
jgi:NagD protein